MNTVRILKNISPAPIQTNSYGRKITISPKASFTITDSLADKIAEDLLTRYGFLKDITLKPEVAVNTVTTVERNERGKRYNKVKKVVKRGQGVKA